MQFQPDARSTRLDLLFALFTTKIYQQDSPQLSTCCGAVMPTPAICMHARGTSCVPIMPIPRSRQSSSRRAVLNPAARSYDLVLFAAEGLARLALSRSRDP